MLPMYPKLHIRIFAPVICVCKDGQGDVDTSNVTVNHQGYKSIDTRPTKSTKQYLNQYHYIDDFSFVVDSIRPLIVAFVHQINTQRYKVVGSRWLVIDPKVIADFYICPTEADGKDIHGCSAIARRPSKSKAERLGAGFIEGQ